MHPPVNPPPPATPSLYEAVGSIPKALAETTAKLDTAEKVLAFHLHHDRMVVRTAKRELIHSAGGIFVTEKLTSASLAPVDPSTLSLNNWPTLRTAIIEVFNGTDGQLALHMINEHSWGLPKIEVGLETHHGESRYEVDESIAAIPQFDFSNADDVARARAELTELAGVTQISEYLMHESTIGVNAPYHERFGPARDRSGGVSVHRTSRGRFSLTEMAKDDIVPSASTLFDMADVDEALVARLRTELKLRDGAWKVIVRREDDQLIYRMHGGGQAHEFDAQGRPR